MLDVGNDDRRYNTHKGVWSCDKRDPASDCSSHQFHDIEPRQVHRTRHFRLLCPVLGVEGQPDDNSGSLEVIQQLFSHRRDYL